MKTLNIKNSTKKISLSAILVIVVFAIYYTTTIRAPQQTSSYIEIGDKTVTVEIAKTPEEKVKGLSVRDSLADNAGMLFLFENKDRLTFWMKDMRFNLDFIWISDNRIVDTHRNVPAPKQSSDSLKTYSPSVPANKVLEVNAGWIEKNFGNEDIRGKNIKIFIQ